MRETALPPEIKRIHQFRLAGERTREPGGKLNTSFGRYVYPKFVVAPGEAQLLSFDFIISDNPT